MNWQFSGIAAVVRQAPIGDHEQARRVVKTRHDGCAAANHRAWRRHGRRISPPRRRPCNLSTDARIYVSGLGAIFTARWSWRLRRRRRLFKHRRPAQKAKIHKDSWRTCRCWRLPCATWRSRWPRRPPPAVRHDQVVVAVRLVYRPGRYDRVAANPGAARHRGGIPKWKFNKWRHRPPRPAGCCGIPQFAGALMRLGEILMARGKIDAKTWSARSNCSASAR